RRGRAWISPSAQNLYFTLALRIEDGPQRLSGLSLIVGLAVMQALRWAGLSDVGVKWPNDIYASGKKLAGILLELSGDPGDVCHVVIGVGINVNMTSTVEQMDQAWTSMRVEAGRVFDRSELIQAICESLHSYLRKHAEAGFSAFQVEWEACNI